MTKSLPTQANSLIRKKSAETSKNRCRELKILFPEFSESQNSRIDLKFDYRAYQKNMKKINK